MKRCDCLACFGFRLAALFFLTGLAALLVIAAILQAAPPARPILIEDGTSARRPPTTQSLPAAKAETATIPADPVARAKFPEVSGQIIDILAAVNKAVNAAIQPEDDLTHYGQTERFVAWPADGKGDCEDYALSKMELLGNMGFPLSGNAILLTVVVLHGGKVDGHALVQLRLPGGGFMYLDNNFDEPMTKRELVAAGYHFFDWTDVSVAAPIHANRARQ